MNITEFMSFDLEWFTTLPGLLITGGVVVLLIALIIFIISNKKTDKKIKEEIVQQPAEPQSMVQPVNTMSPTGVQEISQPVNTATSVEYQMPINEMAATVNVPVAPEISNQTVTNVASNEPTPVTYNSSGSVNILDNPQTIGNVQPVSTAVEIPTFFEQNVPSNINAINVNNSEQAIPAAFNNVAVEAPAVVEPVVTATPVVEQAQVLTEVQPIPVVEQAAPQPTIYGGVSPVVNATPVVEEAKPVIYGGANPLENTATLPVMNNHSAYNNNSYVELNPTAPSVVPSTAEVAPSVAPEAPVAVMSENNQIPVEPVVAAPQMPTTGVEMFGVNDSNLDSSNASNEIETLDF